MADRDDRTKIDDVTVREATADELVGVLTVLDGAALETDADAVGAAIERGDVLVAVRRTDRTGDVADRTGDGPAADGTVVGALVLDGREITGVAVRRRRRGQGIGTALVEAAAARRDRLVADFDSGVRPFYESLGFAVEPLDSGRYRGRVATENDEDDAPD